MRMYDIIEKKKRGLALDRQEIRYVVEGYTAGDIPDYQMSALLMAICFASMNSEETYELTMAMMESGDRLNLSAIDGVKVDKHSTGGVGDKTTLVLGPIVAALGVPVAKMSGRGLGHTGGTVDKLESIAGFKTAIDLDKFMEQVNTVGIAVAGQTACLAPADKKIYALRDVTATVDNISLIASSIMSKKLASGADAIVLDVKCGKGAFMKDEESATKLAEAMVDIGRQAGKNMTALVTDMNEPLGRWVGNSVEVYEAITCLQSRGDERLMEVCKHLAGYMLIAAGKATSYKEAETMIDGVIADGRALDKMADFIEAQGGDRQVAYDTDRLPRGAQVVKLISDQAGVVSAIDAELVGKACMALGGGRETKESQIDLSVGIYLDRKIGENVEAGTTMATVYGNDAAKIEHAMAMLKSAYTVGDAATASTQTKMIKKVIV